LALVSGILTGSVAWAVWRTGETGLAVPRWLIFGVVLYLFHEFNKKRLIYYRNLGVSRNALYMGLFAIDTVISGVAIYIAGYGFT
jgi:hypothetical protein